jgi:hypothetical protein
MRIPNPYPGSFSDGNEYDCHITHNRVKIEGVELTGPIAPGGVSVVGGGLYEDGTQNLNRVTITFMVGAVEIDDDAVGKVEVHLPRRATTDD